jgi:hypothetical protein
MTKSPLRVGWVFSLARSGSSITAYAAAAPWKAPTADEIMGPWIRTEPPYNFPPEQARLVRLFKQSGAVLTPEIAALTRSLFEQIAEQSSANRIVSKHPHLRFTPEELADRFPHDRGVWLIRNPLRRLASIHARGWTSIVRPNHDLDFFREYAERWLSLPETNTLVFESLRENPHAYFAKLFHAFGWEATLGDVDTAVAYQQANYHGNSGGVEPENKPSKTVSDSAKSVPQEAVDAYLADPFMQDLFKRLGWSRKPNDYMPMPPGISVRIRNKLARLTSAKQDTP